MGSAPGSSKTLKQAAASESSPGVNAARPVTPGVPKKPIPGRTPPKPERPAGDGAPALFRHSRAHRRVVPEDLLLVLTYRCNSRCVMCGIWEGDQSGKGELTPEEYERILPDTLRWINLTGGEVFLRKDLPEIVAAVRRAAPRAKITISTNGLQPRQTRKLLPAILEADPDIGFAISIDGEEEVHDKVRGIPGGYRKAYETVTTLQEAGVTNLRIAFTATVTQVADNTTHLGKIYDLARRTGVEFTCAVAHNSDHYFKTSSNKGVNTEELARQLDYVAAEELRSGRPKSWLRAYFHQGLVEHARANVRPTPCEAGHTSFMIDPVGDVFPCNILDMSVGNVREHSFMEIWRSQQMESAREVVRQCNQPCWMVCTARASMRRDKKEVLTWVAANKAKAHLRRPIIR
jgi:radical SAM protein with 4Fe4S-binding SPASM domain